MKIKICHRKGINRRVKVNETKNTMINKPDIVLREEKKTCKRIAILRQRENMEINIKLLMK